jgi:hypothetical protein
MGYDQGDDTRAARGTIGPAPGVHWGASVGVTIATVLAAVVAVAVAAFIRHTRRTQTSEACGNLARIYQGEISYYNESTEERGSAAFVRAGPTPARAPSATKYPADPSAWSRDPGWSALRFTIDEPHRYQYRVDATDRGFVVTVIGDLDGDGTFSTFSRSAALNAGEIQGTSIQITNELE